MRAVPVVESIEEAIGEIADGASIMIPGFGPGTPWNLLNALYRRGIADLTIIANTVGFASGEAGVYGVGDFVAAGRVAHIIASFTSTTHPSQVSVAERHVAEGRMRATVMPQGTLAEAIRAGGAGIPAFYTPTGVGTLIAESKERRVFDGREHLLERALNADFALIRAWKADAAGNLVYRRAARNYNPIMAMAAHTVIVEVEEPILPVGALDPDQIHTPGLYVSRLAPIPPDGVRAVNLTELRSLRGGPNLAAADRTTT